tara:strand:- start:656 stop:886 length:231 start_codon:yes stop_codon:yes gene_type:complete
LVTIIASVITSKDACCIKVTKDKNNRTTSIYTVTFYENKQLTVVIASNGYIVTAYPSSLHSEPLVEEDQPLKWMHI